jgi:hypothetical protein
MVLKPFLTALNRFPKLKAVLYCSGAVLGWVERNNYEMFILIQEMVARKQIELLSGAFYEPALSLFPSDQVGQVEIMTTYLRKAFGRRPQGCYVPAAAWTQDMVSLFQTCGLSYVFLDKELFPPESNEGVFICEHRGRCLYALPITESCGNPSELDAAGDVVSVFFDNGGDYDAVFICLSALVEEGKVEVMLPSRLLKLPRTVPRVCFLKAFDKSFLIERPEAMNIYANILYMQVFIDQIKGDKPRKQAARAELWKAEGVSLFTPDIVIPHIRHAAYTSILQAEKIATEGAGPPLSLTPYDFNFDGINEYLIQNGNYNCILSEERACITELDFLPPAWNYLDTYTGPDTPELFEGSGRHCFSDGICIAGNMEAPGAFGDCVPVKYSFDNIERNGGKICFKSTSLDCGAAGGLNIVKCYHYKKGAFTVNWTLMNTAETTVSLCFYSALNLAFADNDPQNLRVYGVAEGQTAQDEEKTPALLVFDDNGEGSFDKIKRIAFQDVPNETVIRIEAGAFVSARLAHRFEAGYYQHTNCVFTREITVPGGGKAALRLTVKLD